MKYFSTRGADQFLSFEEVVLIFPVSLTDDSKRGAPLDCSRRARARRRALHPRTYPFSARELADGMEGLLIRRPLCRGSLSVHLRR